MGRLSRDQAVSLLDELHDVVGKIRFLEAKYELGHQTDTPEGLGVNLMAALRPYGQDPEVRGRASQAGLKLPPVDNFFAPAISMKDSQDNVSELLFARGPRQIAEATLQSKRLGSEALGSTPEVARKLLVVPALSCTPGQRTFSIKHRRNASVKELRMQLAASMQMPLGKMRVLSEANGKTVAMGDHESAENATILFVRSTAAPFHSAGTVKMGRLSTLAQCLQMHQDVLDNLARASRPVSAQRLKQVQTSVFFRYGFTSSTSGEVAMLHALDQYVCSAEIRCRVDLINQMMGFRPQVYNLQLKGVKH